MSDPMCWHTSAVARHVLITHVSLRDAEELATPGDARDSVEAFIEAHGVVSSPLRGVILFVIAEDGGILGFIETEAIADGTYTWTGPHGPLGPLFPASGHQPRRR